MNILSGPGVHARSKLASIRGQFSDLTRIS